MLARPAYLVRDYQDFQRHGSDVTFNGVVYRAHTREVSGALTGSVALPVGVLKQFIASADSRVFAFSPLDWAPWTAVDPPQEGNRLVWMGWNYEITHVTHEPQGDDTVELLCYCLRDII